MKTVFDKTTRDELINRINTLNENSIAQWGQDEYLPNDKTLYTLGRMDIR